MCFRWNYDTHEEYDSEWNSVKDECESYGVSREEWEEGCLIRDYGLDDDDY